MPPASSCFDNGKDADLGYSVNTISPNRDGT